MPLVAAALHWSLRDPRISSTNVGLRSLGDLHATEELLQLSIPDALWREIHAVELDDTTWCDPPHEA